MADGISLNIRLEAITTKLTGLGPRAWIVPFSGECADGPSVDTAWGPCPDPEAAACQRNETEPCTDACGNAGTSRCDWTCSSPGRCFAEASSTVEPSSCAEVSSVGSATCSDAAGAATLVSGPLQAGGVRLPQRIAIGSGPITIVGRPRSSPGSSELPGEGWRLLALLGDPPLGWVQVRSSARALAGVTGYALEWRFDDISEEGSQNDDTVLFAVDGPGLFESLCTGDPGWGCYAFVWPGLSGGSAGPQGQEMRLVVVPDDPATAEDETAVAAFRAGNFGPVLLGAGCYAGSCPITLSPGDELTVAMSATTTSNDALVELPLPGGLAVTRIGSCE